VDDLHGGAAEADRLVALDVFPSPEIPRKLDALKRHCETEGRTYDEIQNACMWNFEVGGGRVRGEGDH
jgi:hypothetical protein